MLRKSQDSTDPDAQDWWTQKPDPDTKKRWQMAVPDYLILNEKEPEEVKHTIEMTKECIKFAKKYDERWRGFNPEKFNTYLYPGHLIFYNQIRNKLDAFVLEAKNKKKADQKLLRMNPTIKKKAEQDSENESKTEQIPNTRRRSSPRGKASDVRSTGSKNSKKNVTIDNEAKLFDGPPAKQAFLK